MRKLCYVSHHWAYFTTQKLSKQWGDDWDDAPHEHNAGEPYHASPERGESWEITQVAYIGPFKTPCDEHFNSPFSVEQINSGAIAWLRPEFAPPGTACIPAGTELDEFCRIIEAAGGKVFVDRLAPLAKRGEMPSADMIARLWSEAIVEAAERQMPECIVFAEKLLAAKREPMPSEEELTQRFADWWERENTENPESMEEATARLVARFILTEGWKK